LVDGIAEMLVFLVAGVVSWVVVDYLTEKVTWVIVKRRRKSRTGKHTAWRY